MATTFSLFLASIENKVKIFLLVGREARARARERERERKRERKQGGRTSVCLRSESWASIAPAFWHGPWSTTASLSLGWAVPDMACSEFRTGRTASCLVVCQRLSHCRSLHPDLFFVNRPRLLVPRLSSHIPTPLLLDHATKECPSHSLAGLVTTHSLNSIPPLFRPSDKPSQPPATRPF